jgi:hypothetical protein
MIMLRYLKLQIPPPSQQQKKLDELNVFTLKYRCYDKDKR